jgi:hypothetical protein
MQLATQNGKAIEFTQGDDVTLELIALDGDGNPVDLTGASLSTQVLGPNGAGVTTFPNSQHTLANQTTNRGQFALALGNVGEDTTDCGEGANKEMLTVAVISGVQTTFRGPNLLTVYPEVPVQ